MIELTVEEYAQLLWCAIHDDRKLVHGEKEITRHWDEFPLQWKQRFNDRAHVSKLDITGAELRQQLA